jgi:fluoride ion exporter CrcB/FEX
MMSFTQYLLIALGGALGALSRYFVGLAVTNRLSHSTFPWG